MGQVLSEPVTEKSSKEMSNSQWMVGSSSMQGWRVSMEDAHTHILTMEDDPAASFFAVYDGHGAATVAEYAGVDMHKRIVAQAQYRDGDIGGAMKAGYMSLDEEVLGCQERFGQAGSTAVSVLIRESKLYCANVGDSRAVLSRTGKQIALTYDHKPSLEAEQDRITAAGGYVRFNRVNGGLAMTRALGDVTFKGNPSLAPDAQIVIAMPDIVTDEITEDDEFLVLACDGIWDVLSNQEVVDFVRDRISAKRMPVDICEELMTHCLAPDCRIGGAGCDNMTVIIACMLHGGTFDDLAAKCARSRPQTPPPQLPPRPTVVPGSGGAGWSSVDGGADPTTTTTTTTADAADAADAGTANTSIQS
ncbi:probable protein phosphatase 2C T23F11.1 [Sycon ciliatum]|uniref:probable protein phosphatase 2C T23F11.1 n=1 Tax=Sycon ciliatum TaxID=27933 RepID=UPI0031F68585